MKIKVSKKFADFINKTAKELGVPIITEEEFEQKKKQLLALENVSPIKKIFSKIKSFFIYAQPNNLSLTEEENNTLDGLLQEYKDSDSEILSYNLEDNLIQIAFFNKNYFIHSAY